VELTSPDQAFGVSVEADRLTFIALALAYGIVPPDEVAASNGLTRAELARLIRENSYLRDQIKAFASAKAGGGEQVLIGQAQFAVAELIPTLTARIRSGAVSDAPMATIFKTLTGLAVANAEGSGQSGNTININFNPDPRLTRVPRGVTIDQDR